MKDYLQKKGIPDEQGALFIKVMRKYHMMTDSDIVLAVHVTAHSKKVGVQEIVETILYHYEAVPDSMMKFDSIISHRLDLIKAGCPKDQVNEIYAESIRSYVKMLMEVAE